MSKKPKALALAEWLDGYEDSSAAELQNAYAQIESLQHAVSKAQTEAARYANPMVIGQRDALAAVLRELDECAAYWSEYDVPLGIHDRIKAALALIT